ncbi:MAG: hypothetical protein ACYDCL_06470 [Myxococcales bacterium]
MIDDTPLSPDLEALIAAERPELVPPPGARDRVWARVAAGVAGPGTGHVRAPRTAHGGAVARLLGPKAVLAAVSFSLGAGSGAAVVLRLRPSIPPAAVPPAPMAAATPPVEGPTEVAPSLAAEVPAHPTPAHPPARRPPAVSSQPAVGVPAQLSAVADDLAAERLLVEQARTALERGDAAAALAAATAHARRWPKGTLAEERDMLRIQALAGLGRAAEARAAAAEFEREHPHSLLLSAVDALVKSLP